jgi:hypothetical protein
MDDEDVWSEISEIALAQCGRAWFDKDGNLHFEDGSFPVRPQDNSYDDPTTVQYTFTSGDFQGASSYYDYDQIYNHIIVEYFSRRLAPLQVVYEQPEIYVVPPSESLTVRAEFRYPVYSLASLTQDTDWKIATSAGVDMSSDVTLTLGTTYAHSIEITIANSSQYYAAYVNKLQLRGYPAIPYPAARYECEDSDSIDLYGRRTWKIKTPYIQNYRHAQLVADFLLERFRNPLPQVKLTGVRGVPYLEVGDRVQVTSDRLTETSTTGGDLDEYFIGRIAWRYAPGQAYRMDMDLLRASDLYPYDNYFIIGTSYYGSGANQGRLFW